MSSQCKKYIVNAKKKRVWVVRRERHRTLKVADVDFFKKKRSFHRPIRACCSEFVPMESLQTSGQTCTGGASWNYATNAVGKAHILPRKSYN